MSLSCCLFLHAFDSMYADLSTVLSSLSAEVPRATMVTLMLQPSLSAPQAGQLVSIYCNTVLQSSPHPPRAYCSHISVICLSRYCSTNVSSNRLPRYRSTHYAINVCVAENVCLHVRFVILSHVENKSLTRILH